METYPLVSLTIAEAIALQFKLVDTITQFFPGNEILMRGDLGVVAGLNKPVTTHKIEQVLAKFFDAEAAILVRGAGTNAIRLALNAIGKKKVLIHTAPIYPTTKVSLEMLGTECIAVDFNQPDRVQEMLRQVDIDFALIQVTRQLPGDAYDLAELIQSIRQIRPDLPIVTDDNYAVLKTQSIGVQLGANLSCFSTFKLLGPEGIGCIVGDRSYIEAITRDNYSGGGQVQGHEALEVLRGMVYAPVAHAIATEVGTQVCQRLNEGEILGVKQAWVVNAQSRVIVVELEQPLACSVIQAASQYGALPYPVGAESKYEICPLFYRVSGTFRAMLPEAEKYMIRINPNRAGVDTIIRILDEALKDAQRRE